MGSYGSLPNDPIGDGVTGCYMAAFDTSTFSTDSRPLTSCAQLDSTRFPDHDCIEIRTPEDFRSMAAHERAVGIILNDLDVTGHTPFITNQVSHVYIGTYEEETLRPIHLHSDSTVFNWVTSAQAPEASLAVINVRMNSGNLCFAAGARQAQLTLTLQSVTAKCNSRILMMAFETPPESVVDDITDFSEWPTDDRVYFRNVMGRSRVSHTVYVDRTYVNWVEDSIILGSYSGGKHALKLEGQNVVVRNTIAGNLGAHGEPIVDPEFGTTVRTGNLATLSLAAGSRVVLDHVTSVMHYTAAESNPNAVQSQIRDAIGAASDMPLGYRPNTYPTSPYRGPVDYLGEHYASSPFWDPSFWASIDTTDWDNPHMLVSFVTNSEVIQTIEDPERYQPHLYALMTTGTYPTTRPSSGSASGWIIPEVPADWVERQRIVVAGNCFDNGLLETNIGHAWPPLRTGPGMTHPEDNTEKFIILGSNRCADPDDPPAHVVSARDAYIAGLPQPPWLSW